jgi:hypothetical protein
VNCNRTISQLPVLPLKITTSDKNTLLESSKLKAKNSANKRKRDVNQLDNEDKNKNILTLVLITFLKLKFIHIFQI